MENKAHPLAACFFVRNHSIDFNTTWLECFFGETLPRLFMIRQNMAARGWGLFSLYIYTEA